MLQKQVRELTSVASKSIAWVIDPDNLPIS
jgi:hypothetical protein